MAVAIDQATSAEEIPASGTTLTVSISPTGSNRAAWVGGWGANDPRPSDMSATFGGVSMVEQGDLATGGDYGRLAGYSLAGIGTGSQSVVLTTVGIAGGEQLVVVLTMTSVDQTTPVGTPQTVANAAATGTSTLTVTSVNATDLVVDVLGHDFSLDETVGADQTVRASKVASSGDEALLISSQAGTAGGVMSWTLGGSSAFGIGSAQIAIAFKEAAGGGAATAYSKKKDRVPVPQRPGPRPGARGPFIPVQFRSTVNAPLPAAALTVTDVDQAQALDAVTLTSDTSLAAADVAQAQSLDAVALTQQNTLTVADIAQAQGLDALVLTQANVLAVADVAQGQALDPVTTSALLQTGGLGGFLVSSPVPVRPGRGPWAGPFIPQQFRSLTNPEAATVLSVADVAQTQSLDAVALTQANVLAVADIAQAQALDSVALTQSNILAVADALQAQGLDGVVLVQQNTLAVADIGQDQALDAIVLSGAALLQMADLIQSQSLETVDLIQQYVLAIQDALQDQGLDSVVLTQGYLLVAADLHQSLTLDTLFVGVQHPFETEVAAGRSRSHTAGARDLIWTAPRRQD